MQRGDGDGDQAWDVVAASLLHPHLQLVAAVSTQQVPGHSARQQHRLGIYLFIYYLKAYSPRQPHRVTSGIFTRSSLTEVT